MLKMEQPLTLPDGTPVEVDVYLADEPRRSEENGWSILGMARLEDEWNNPAYAIYDDWKKLF